jgi:hypothetical protein
VALDVFAGALTRSPLAGAAVIAASVLSGPPLLMLLHELGHALAAWALGRRVVEISVGNPQPALVLHIRGLRVSLGWPSDGRSAGFIVHRGPPRSALNVFVVAAAGPAASLLVGGIATWGAITTGPHVPLLGVWLATAAGGTVTHAVMNLIPSGDSPASWNDGACMRAAWRARRTSPANRAPHPEPPHEASVTPSTTEP